VLKSNLNSATARGDQFRVELANVRKGKYDSAIGVASQEADHTLDLLIMTK